MTNQQFGFAAQDGHSANANQRALDQPLLYLAGLHCHIGSQVTEASLYGEAIRQTVPLMGWNCRVRWVWVVTLSGLWCCPR